MTERRRFEGKTAVITGSAQGIGRTVALTMAREGGKLALVDKSDLVHEVQRRDRGRWRRGVRDHRRPGEIRRLLRGDGAWARTVWAGSTFS